MLLIFDLATTTIKDFRRKIEINDRKYGSHSMTWEPRTQIVRVGWADHKEVKMATFGSAADALKRAKAAVHAEVDKFVGEVEGFVSRELPAGMAEARSHLEVHRNDLNEMRAEMRQLTNGGET